MTDFASICTEVGLALFASSILLGLVRAWRGPTLADRVIALDMMTAAVVGSCGLFAMQMSTAAVLDIAVALALVSFISVVALARFADRLQRKGDDDA